MNQEDKRVQRTRKRLAEALVDLSIKDGYDAVTIQDLTDHADINYRTFFRHYDSKDALLRDVLQATLADLRDVLQPPSASDFNDAAFEKKAQSNCRLIYEYVSTNSDFFLVLLQSGPVALEPVQEFARAEIENIFAALPASAIPHELIANHMISTHFSLIEWWLDNEMVYSAEQMAEYATRLIMLPARRLLLEQSTENVVSPSTVPAYN